MKLLFFAGKNYEADRPQLVTALKDGVKMSATESSKGHWGPMFWSYKPLYNNVSSNPNVPCPMFQLLLDFKQPLADGERHILDHLSKLLDSQLLADVEFVVQGQPMSGHANILVAGSPVLSAMFQSDMTESRTRTVVIEDTQPAVFRHLMRYLYTGKAPTLLQLLDGGDGDDMIESLFVAADKYQVESLKSVCEEGLRQKLQLASVTSSSASASTSVSASASTELVQSLNYLVLAHLHSASRLFEEAIRFVCRHNRHVWQLPQWRQLATTYPDVFYTAAHRINQYLNSPRTDSSD